MDDKEKKKTHDNLKFIIKANQLQCSFLHFSGTLLEQRNSVLPKSNSLLGCVDDYGGKTSQT